MNHSIFAAILLFLLASIIFAQKPTPTPSDDDVVKISTTLIQIDVSVTDKKGKPIKDLKPEDFEIYENQQKQPITNFSFIETENSPQSETKPTPKETNSKINSSLSVQPAKLKPENIRRTIAFVIDDLSLAFDGIAFTRKALRNFVDKQMRDGDLIAIIRTGTGIGALQQFTSDKRILHSAIENIRLNRYGARSFAITRPSSDVNETESSKDLQTAEEEYDDIRRSVFSIGTLGAVSYVVNGMRDLPGRKSIMMISNSLSLKNRERQPDEKAIKALRSLTEAANRASVVIYTMIAAGMSAGNMFSAEEGEFPNMQSEGGFSEFQRMILAQGDQWLDNVENQEGLVRLASETGGLSIINKEELGTNIQTMLTDQKSYYLLAYQPNEDTFNAKTARFNKLIVKVNRPDVRVRYRSGFFGLTDEQVKTNVKLSVSDQISNALTSPFAKNDINIRMASLFGNSDKNSFVRSFLHIESKDMTFTDEPNGWKKASFNVFAFIFGDNGLPVDQISKTHTFRINPETYKQIQEGGIIYNFNMIIKKPGAYQFRIALRDTVSEKIGSASQFIEVPDLRKKRLTLSGITLENFTPDEWQKSQQSSSQIVESKAPNKIQRDTALRQFKRSSILTFGYTVYNAKLDNSNKKPDLKTQIRLFRDGKLVLDGVPKPLELNGLKNLEAITTTGAISLANQIQAGEYILQIVVTDTLAKSKTAISTQSVEFEVIE